MKYIHTSKSRITLGERNVPEHRILMDETFARKCLLGSMKIMGNLESLRPNWTNYFHIDYSEDESTLLGNFMIHIVDEVLSVDEDDLKEVMRTLNSSEQGEHIPAQNQRNSYGSTYITQITPFLELLRKVDTSVLAYIIEHGNFVTSCVFQCLIKANLSKH